MIDPQAATEIPKALIDTGLASFILGASLFGAKQVIGMVLMLKNKSANGNGSLKKCGIESASFQAHLSDIRSIGETQKRDEQEHRDMKDILMDQVSILNRMTTVMDTQTRILERIDGRR